MIAHSVRDVPVDDQFINALKARDVAISPTFTRSYRRLSTMPPVVGR
jgi:hypothetical protein